MGNQSNSTVSATAVANTIIPVGTILPYIGPDNQVPNGFLLCNGQAIVQTTYPDLYALVGGNLPDLRSRFLVGAGQGAGLSNYGLKGTGGDESVSLSVDQIPPHSHPINGGNFGVHNKSFKHDGTSNHPFETNPDTALSGTDSAGGGQSHENRPPWYALNYIVKY
ncbi:MAG: tail fiber protein [Bacteroidota bacterium]